MLHAYYEKFKLIALLSPIKILMHFVFIKSSARIFLINTCRIDADRQKIKRIAASKKITKLLLLLRIFADFSLPLLAIFEFAKKEVVSTVIVIT